MDQLSMFRRDPNTNLMTLSVEALGDDYSEAFTMRVLALARTGRPFTSEDITDAVGLPRSSEQNRNNAVGALMKTMARQQHIHKTGRWVRSRHARSNARELREWVGNSQCANKMAGHLTRLK